MFGTQPGQSDVILWKLENILDVSIDETYKTEKCMADGSAMPRGYVGIRRIEDCCHQDKVKPATITNSQWPGLLPRAAPRGSTLATRACNTAHTPCLAAPSMHGRVAMLC